jgi:hypothetical protein
MGLYDELGLDPNIDRNSFTKEQAAQVFEKAAKEMSKGDLPATVLDALVNTGFHLLQMLATHGKL